MFMHSPISLLRVCVLARIVKSRKMAKKKDSYAAEFARKGGRARAKKLTPEQRKESARKAAQARWAKAKKHAEG